MYHNYIFVHTINLKSLYKYVSSYNQNIKRKI